MVALWLLAVRRYMVQTITICNATITHVHPRPPLSKRTRFRSHFLREHATGTMGFIEPHQWPHGGTLTLEQRALLKQNYGVTANVRQRPGWRFRCLCISGPDLVLRDVGCLIFVGWLAGVMVGRGPCGKGRGGKRGGKRFGEPKAPTHRHPPPPHTHPRTSIKPQHTHTHTFPPAHPPAIPPTRSRRVHGARSRRLSDGDFSATSRRRRFGDVLAKFRLCARAHARHATPRTPRSRHGTHPTHAPHARTQRAPHARTPRTYPTNAPRARTQRAHPHARTPNTHPIHAFHARTPHMHTTPRLAEPRTHPTHARMHTRTHAPHARTRTCMRTRTRTRRH